MRIINVLCLLAAALLAGACKESETAVARATRNGILLMGNTAEPRGLDPHIVSGVLENNIIRGLFEGLVVEHPSKDGVALPGMAESWKATDPENPTQWNFFLRKDAVWSDGTPLTSEDFLFAFERILTPALGSEYSFMLYYIIGAEDFHKGKTTDFSTVQVSAPDLHTLRVNLRAPIPFLPEITKHYTWFPVPKHVILENGKADNRFNPWTKPENIVSNGAFVLKSWRLNDHIEIKKNTRYWDADNVALNGIRFLPISNSYTEDRMFYNDQLHITYTIAPDLIGYSREHFPEMTRNELYLGTYFIRCNVANGPLKDVRVRKALSMAIDQQSIIDYVTMGNQSPAAGIVPPFGGYDSPGDIKFDPQSAAKLLADAGYPQGEGLPKIKFLTTDRESAKRLGETLQAMWKEHLGINISIQQMEWTSYLNSMMEKQYDLAAGGWIGDYMDPLTFLDMWIKDGGNNRTNWSNEEFEALLLKAEKTADPAERYRILGQAEALFLDARPILPVYWYTRNYLIHTDVKGWHPLLLDNHPYKFMKLGG
jgi:oligopeptide transport system substrate-binding protein